MSNQRLSRIRGSVTATLAAVLIGVAGFTAGPAAAAPAPAVQAVAPAATAVKLWVSDQVRTYNAAKATVIKVGVSATGGSVPRGIIAIRYAGKPVGRIVLDANGKATYTIPRHAAAGKRTYQAVFEPTSTKAFTTSSATIGLRITKAKPQVSVTVNPKVIPFGKPGTAKFTVKGNGYVPTGEVALVTAKGTVVSRGKLNAAGVATLPTSKTQVPGSYRFKAVYVGDANTQRVETFPTYSIRKVTPTVTLRLSKTSATTNQAVRAVVNVTSGSGTVGGSVKVRVNATEYGPVKLVAGTATITIPAGQAAGRATVSAHYLESSKFRVAGTKGMHVTYRTAMGQCPAAAVACVDLTNEVTWLQKNGQVVYGPVPITAGKAGHRTNVGDHRVFWKNKHHRSSIFNNAPMPNSVFFDGGIAFHQGSLTAQSHGCIHLSWDASEYFFNYLKVGDQVSVFGTDPY